jgi:redox-regulated HSP33 family molecular chaperone
MTAFLNEDLRSNVKADVQVWLCEDCRCVHVRAANVMLTFTKDEFESFTEAVVDCNYGFSYFNFTHKNKITDEENSLLPLISEAEN